MKCGPRWAGGGARYGFGWPSSAPAGASWLGCWAAATRPRPGACGKPCPGITTGITDFTDLFPVHVDALPHWRHRRCPKGDGGTSVIEAVNYSLCQRCGVLVRKSCSFSRSLIMHTARIKIVIDNYNLTLTWTTAKKRFLHYARGLFALLGDGLGDKCIVPKRSSVFFGLEFRTHLWDKYFTAAPA